MTHFFCWQKKRSDILKNASAEYIKIIALGWQTMSFSRDLRFRDHESNKYPVVIGVTTFIKSYSVLFYFWLYLFLFRSFAGVCVGSANCSFLSRLSNCWRAMSISKQTKLSWNNIWGLGKIGVITY
jgi:hypothetical protein